MEAFLTTKERPLLMSSEMVRATLDGPKTQTRRLIKDANLKAFQGDLDDPNNEDNSMIQFIAKNGHSGPGFYVWDSEYPDEGGAKIECPHGQPGDHLWVQEDFFLVPDEGNANGHEKHVYYRASALHPELPKEGWIPPIHMPRWAARLILEITEVRVQRIQEISEEDARAEGVEPQLDKFGKYHKGGYRCAFSTLFNKIYPEAWERNDWVWAISYRRVKA